MLLALCAGAAHAHKASDGYVQLAGGGAAATTLRVDVALRDLDVALDIDANGDGKLTWGEVRAAWPGIEGYVQSHLQLEGCELRATGRLLERRADGVYAALQLQGDCRQVAAPAIRYSMLADVDPTHRGIARVEWAGTPSELKVLVPRSGGAMEVTSVASPNATVGTSAGVVQANDTGTEHLQFLREGMRHILAGYDHVVFLICLLLPSVMRRTGQAWQPVERLAQAVWPVAGIVTAFTLAHSITLVLAATGTMSIPASIIEPAIAVTIILAALDNVWPIFHGRRAVVTFVFGLVHGFGFAGVLAELELPAGQFAWALLQFNVGLELGQLLIVVAVAALLFLLRHRARYPALFIRGGSAAAMVVGGVWLIERTTNLSLMAL